MKHIAKCVCSIVQHILTIIAQFQVHLIIALLLG